MFSLLFPYRPLGQCRRQKAWVNNHISQCQFFDLVPRAFPLNGGRRGAPPIFLGKHWERGCQFFPHFISQSQNSNPTSALFSNVTHNATVFYILFRPGQYTETYLYLVQCSLDHHIACSDRLSIFYPSQPFATSNSESYQSVVHDSQ